MCMVHASAAAAVHYQLMISWTPRFVYFTHDSIVSWQLHSAWIFWTLPGYCSFVQQFWYNKLLWLLDTNKSATPSICTWVFDAPRQITMHATKSMGQSIAKCGSNRLDKSNLPGNEENIKLNVTQVTQRDMWHIHHKLNAWSWIRERRACLSHLHPCIAQTAET